MWPIYLTNYAFEFFVVGKFYVIYTSSLFIRSNNFQLSSLVTYDIFLCFMEPHDLIVFPHVAKKGFLLFLKVRWNVNYFLLLKKKEQKQLSKVKQIRSCKQYWVSLKKRDKDDNLINKKKFIKFLLKSFMNLY